MDMPVLLIDSHIMTLKRAEIVKLQHSWRGSKIAEHEISSAVPILHRVRHCSSIFSDCLQSGGPGCYETEASRTGRIRSDWDRSPHEQLTGVQRRRCDSKAVAAVVHGKFTEPRSRQARPVHRRGV